MLFYTNDNGGLLILLSLLASSSTSITIAVTALAIALPRSLLWITSICPICSSLNRQKKVKLFTGAQNIQSYSAVVHSHAKTSNAMNISYFLKLPVTRHLINPLAFHS